jgi:hypothetical protein
MIQADQTIPFDVSQMRTVYFNLSDPDELEDACTELTRHVGALQGTDEIETPVKASLRLKQALESSDPATAGNAEVLAALQGMRHEIERVRVSQARSSRIDPTIFTPKDFYKGEKGMKTWLIEPKTSDAYITHVYSPSEELPLTEEPIPADPPPNDAGKPSENEE